MQSLTFEKWVFWDLLLFRPMSDQLLIEDVGLSVIKLKPDVNGVIILNQSLTDFIGKFVCYEKIGKNYMCFFLFKYSY